MTKMPLITRLWPSKPGFSEINFVKMGNWNANDIEINPNMTWHAYLHDKNPKMAKISQNIKFDLIFAWFSLLNLKVN